MIIIKYILYYKLYIPRFWLSISKNVTRYLVFSFVIFLFLPINESYPNNLCDKLAALESDPKKTSKPVLFEDLNSKLIINICTSAIKESRNTKHISRFYLQRARGYLKIRDVNNAISDLNKSYELGYPAAAFALATLYYLGDDVTQDLEQARVLFIHSYENGVLWSAWGLSLLYRNVMYENFDLEEAKKWEVRFKNGY